MFITLLRIFVLPCYLLLVLLFVKNNNAFRNRKMIIDAIRDYSVSRVGDTESLALYKFMESYEKTLYRFWDWGYTNILPPDKFKLIKPYVASKRF